MSEKEILELGFKKITWKDDGQDFTEYKKESGNYGILISGTTLVEVFATDSIVTVKNCNTINDLKQLIRLFL